MNRLGVAILRTVMRSIGRRSSPALRRFIVVMSQLHLLIYRASLGVLGRRLGLRRAQILVLTTIGRRTGKPRTVPLLTVDDGDGGLVIVASHGGLDEPPGWWLNLAAHPVAVVEAGGRRFTVSAERVGRDRYSVLWRRLVEAFPGYEDYRLRTPREMPIVVLRPRV
jgi:deazaflavin-dependent oxidoreductase (nitroreductase family)